jgi:hypothetical protein
MVAAAVISFCRVSLAATSIFAQVAHKLHGCGACLPATVLADVHLDESFCNCKLIVYQRRGGSCVRDEALGAVILRELITCGSRHHLAHAASVSARCWCFERRNDAAVAAWMRLFAAASLRARAPTLAFVTNLSAHPVG